MTKDNETEWKNRIRDKEEQYEDMVHCTKQIEDFYKRKLSSITEENDDNRKHIDELKIKNSRLADEKNKLTFELDLTRKELSNMKDLLHAAQKDVCTNEETTYYVEELKSQLLARQDQVKKLKFVLNEAKEEYISVITKERIIKEQEEELLEKQEIIDDLAGDLENVKVCLKKKTEEVDMLEERLENENDGMGYNCKMQDMLKQINTLENVKLKLLAKVQVLEKPASIKQSTEDSECKNDVLERSYYSPKDDKYQDIAIKKKVCIDHEVKSLDKSTEIDNNHLTIDVDPQMKEKITWIESENSALKEKLTQSMTTIQSLKEESDESALILNELSKLTVKYDDLKAQYKEKCQMFDDLEHGASILRQKLENISEEMLGTSATN